MKILFGVNKLGEKIKVLESEDYNYRFNLSTGLFMRYGETFDDDPEYSPYGPELLDIEISTICHNGCEFCYKTNVGEGENMSLETFKEIFKKFPKSLTQIAFGIGDIDGNPDLFDIMWYCRDNDVIPNITINGSRMKKKYYDKLVAVCGAVAVSLYDFDTCYNAVQELSSRGLKQVNIHSLLSEETYDQCIKAMQDSKTDERLKGLNAVVFLQYKAKNKICSFKSLLNKSKYKRLVDYAFDNEIAIGFDSCSANMFISCIQDRKNKDALEKLIEPCESFGLFSGYINVKGVYFPCSFGEGIGEWESGIDLLKSENFMSDVWYSPLVNKYRQLSLESKDIYGCRKCLFYNLEPVE